MPTCSDGYISNEIAELMEKNEYHSVLECAQLLHSVSTGNFDVPLEVPDDANTIVEFYINNWRSDASKSFVFDTLVLLLLQNAASEWKIARFAFIAEKSS